MFQAIVTLLAIFIGGIIAISVITTGISILGGLLKSAGDKVEDEDGCALKVILVVVILFILIGLKEYLTS